MAALQTFAVCRNPAAFTLARCASHANRPGPPETGMFQRTVRRRVRMSFVTSLSCLFSFQAKENDVYCVGKKSAACAPKAGPMIKFARFLMVFVAVATWSPTAGAGSEFDRTWNVVLIQKAGRVTHRIMLMDRSSTDQSSMVGFLEGLCPAALYGCSLFRPYPCPGSERLSANSGRGTWRGQGPNGPCSGTWTARRK